MSGSVFPFVDEEITTPAGPIIFPGSMRMFILHRGENDGRGM